ncbi:hypothetical protein niasHT_022318 [Heterodera trifolii]|uniref:Secreted protein n=1 Tax=Heterodera trifolii TaxID=157864 RepID=A0ABD2KPH3_9BILA
MQKNIRCLCRAACKSDRAILSTVAWPSSADCSTASFAAEEKQLQLRTGKPIERAPQKEGNVKRARLEGQKERHPLKREGNGGKTN